MKSLGDVLYMVLGLSRKVTGLTPKRRDPKGSVPSAGVTSWES